MVLHLSFEGCENLAHEHVVAMPWERVVGEQQQPVMGSTAVLSTLVAANELGDVVGDHRPAFLRGVLEEVAVVDAAQVFELVVLNGHDVVAAVAKLTGDRGRDHLVEQQPHSSKARSAS
ncbi:MAG TPA: hypothetical protein VGA69_12315 [Nitriliruptorales bacterium]